MSSKTSLNIIYLFCFLGLFLQGCAKYKSQRVAQKEKVSYLFEERKDKLDLYARAFDQDEFKEYLPDYQPVHLRIKNKTASPQKLAVSDISLSVEPFKNIKNKMPKMFVINFVPCVVGAVLGMFFWWQIVLPAVVVLGLCGAQQSLREHDQSLDELKKNALFPQNGALIIPPYSTSDTLIFVKRIKYNPRFTIAISNMATDDKTIFKVFITARTVKAFHVR